MGAEAVAIDDPTIMQALQAGKNLTLKWISADTKKSCTVPLKFNAPPPKAPVVAQADDLKDCAEAADAYENGIKAQPHTLVVFCGNGQALSHSSRSGNAAHVGDPIYIGVYTDGSQIEIKFNSSNCATRDPTPKRFGTDNFNNLPTLTGGGVRAITPATPREFYRCFNTSVPISVTSRVSAENTTVTPLNNSTTIQQYELYNYSLQLGAVFTNDVTHDYAVTADSSGTNRVRDQGPFGKGPKYFAALTLYGLPWQIKSLFGGEPYHGRDLVNDQRILDRISAVLGVGLDHPQNEFEAGLAFELTSGVNAIGVYRRAKIDVLDGIAVGDAFKGAASDLPKKSEWKGGFYVGIAVDLRYVMDWFARKTP